MFRARAVASRYVRTCGVIALDMTDPVKIVGVLGGDLLAVVERTNLRLSIARVNASKALRAKVKVTKEVCFVQEPFPCVCSRHVPRRGPPKSPFQSFFM